MNYQYINYDTKMINKIFYILQANGTCKSFMKTSATPEKIMDVLKKRIKSRQDLNP
jgi:cytochrome oxidase Cu insertion factor (SCO1/SenC/PrrC family)